MKTIQVSKFKARCLGILKEIRDTGEPLILTLRGKALAVIQPPASPDPTQPESISATLARLRPLLLAEEEEFEPATRTEARPSATRPLAEDQ